MSYNAGEDSRNSEEKPMVASGTVRSEMEAEIAPKR